MAAPTNTATTLNTIGIREDLEDVIYRVAPEDAPFTANIGTAKATTVKHDWQTEGLASPNANNAALEGDDIASLDASNLTTRLENICQIFRKTGEVSETQDAVIAAGREAAIGAPVAINALTVSSSSGSSISTNVDAPIGSLIVIQVIASSSMGNAVTGCTVSSGDTVDTAVNVTPLPNTAGEAIY